jgi:pimeloyl-ACP methyl ester carboxylesterase
MTIPPVALIHGFASSFDHGWARHGWPDVLADAGRAVIPVSLLGHGASPHPHNPAAYDDLEAHALSQLPNVPLDAVGFSVGARTLLRLAMDFPARFRRLVLMGVGDGLLKPQDPSWLIAALTWIPDTGLADNRTIALRRLAQAEGNDPLALLAFLRRSTKPFDRAMLGRVQARILLIIGSRDDAYPAASLQAALPQAELLTISGLDHFATPSDFRAMEAALVHLG